MLSGGPGEDKKPKFERVKLPFAGPDMMSNQQQAEAILKAAQAQIKGPPGVTKVGMTYSANGDQTNDILQQYKEGGKWNAGITGANQAKVMELVEGMLNDPGSPYSALKGKFHILPITTMHYRKDAEGKYAKNADGEYIIDPTDGKTLQADMQRISDFAAGGGAVLGWQHQASADDFAISGKTGVAYKAGAINDEQLAYIQAGLKGIEAAVNANLPAPTIESYDEFRKRVSAGVAGASPSPVSSPAPAVSPAPDPSPGGAPKVDPVMSPSPSPVAAPVPSPSPAPSPVAAPVPPPSPSPSPAPSPVAAPVPPPSPAPSPAPAASPAPSPAASPTTPAPKSPAQQQEQDKRDQQQKRNEAIAEKAQQAMGEKFAKKWEYIGKRGGMFTDADELKENAELKISDEQQKAGKKRINDGWYRSRDLEKHGSYAGHGLRHEKPRLWKEKVMIHLQSQPDGTQKVNFHENTPFSKACGFAMDALIYNGATNLSLDFAEGTGKDSGRKKIQLDSFLKEAAKRAKEYGVTASFNPEVYQFLDHLSAKERKEYLDKLDEVNRLAQQKQDQLLGPQQAAKTPDVLAPDASTPAGGPGAKAVEELTAAKPEPEPVAGLTASDPSALEQKMHDLGDKLDQGCVDLANAPQLQVTGLENLDKDTAEQVIKMLKAMQEFLQEYQKLAADRDIDAIDPKMRQELHGKADDLQQRMDKALDSIDKRLDQFKAAKPTDPVAPKMDTATADQLKGQVNAVQEEMKKRADAMEEIKQQVENANKSSYKPTT